MKIKQGIVSAALAGAIVFTAATMPAQASADEKYATGNPSPGAMFVDGVVVRPLGLAAMIIGTATYVVTLPFSAIGGNPGQAGDTLVMQPTRFTFKRPLGQFEH